MRKIFKLYDGRLCDESVLRFRFIELTNKIKEYEMLKSALVEKEFEVEE